MITVNALLHIEKTAITKRVLYINYHIDQIVTIDIINKIALPIAENITNIQSLIDNNIVSIQKSDPFIHLLDDSDRTIIHLELRDRAWSIIKDLVLNEDGSPNINIFDSRWRGTKLQQLHDQKISSIKTTLKWLRKYWQRGQIKNCLLPDLIYSGGKGKERTQMTRKLGRPAYVKPSEGIPITDDIKKIFINGIKYFYKPGVNIKRVFDRVVDTYFTTGDFIEQDGFSVPIIAPPKERPTFRQFEHFFRTKRDQNLEDFQKQSHGLKKFENDLRVRTGSSSRMAPGPGYIVQMDSTVLDVYLVSSLDRSRLIGRPILYILVDVWSHLITGFCLTLNGPSWDAARQALYNMFENKVEYCKGFGITISDYDWPWHYSPISIIGDRGESIGENADTLAENFRIELANTAPYMAVWKPIVESKFRLLNNITVEYLPAHVYKKRRGDRDYRLDAVLTLQEIRTIMIRMILYHNKYHVVSNPWSDEGLIRDHIAPHPIDLFDWGMRHKTGLLRSVNLELAKIYLLPEDEASVTGDGIFFRKRVYDSEYARQKQWLAKAKNEGTFRAEIRYDPRDSSYIFIRVDHGKYLPCPIASTYEVFNHRDWYDISTFDHDQNQSKSHRNQSIQQGKTDINTHIDHITSHAKAEAKDAKAGKTKTALTGNVRENRQTELNMEHQQEAPLVVIPTDPISKPFDGYISGDNISDELEDFEKEFQDEKQKSDQD
jgi:putative transposase